MKIIFDNSRIYSYAMNDPKAIGGAERQQWLLARALARRSCEVVVYNRGDESREKCIIEGVIFKWITPSHPLRAWPKILKKEKAEWWYWRCSDYYLGILAPLAHMYGTKVAFACAFDADCQPTKALARRSYLWPLYFMGLKSVNRIIVQHAAQKALLPRTFQHKAHLVPSIAPATHKIPNREKYVAWVGVLRESKRPHLLIELANRLPDVRFVVCGPTSLHRTSVGYANSIVGLLKSCKNIEYKGQVSPDEAQEIISHSSMLLSTSKAEGFPNTLLQAWGASVPVVSLELDPGKAISRVGGGFVADSLDELVNIIPKFFSNVTSNQELGERGYLYIKANHSEDVVASALLNVLVQ